jgi:hypothetical protein
MRTLLRIAVVLFLGYIAIDALLNMKDNPFHSTASPPAAAPEPNHIGDTFVTTHSFISLYSANDAAKAFKLFADNDSAALKSMAFQGRMTLIKQGTTVTLEDRDIFRGVDTFRVRGNPDTSYAVIGQVR